MTPSAALAQVVVDELVRCGVRDVVLCPGSRSAPLAYALLDAVRVGRLRLHVRVDERSAAFLAVGLGKASGRPAAVVTTSGTAVANLHPVVLEAHEAGVPLLLLTADRPPELRGTRANQTTDQTKLFGDAARWFHDLGAPDRRAGQQAGWRTGVDRAVAAAVAALGGDPGPVHLNVPLRDPLAPDLVSEPAPEQAGESAAALAFSASGDGGHPGDAADAAAPGTSGGWPESLAGRADGGPWTSVGPSRAPGRPSSREESSDRGMPRDPSAASGAGGRPDGADAYGVGEEARTVVVLGDLAGDLGTGGALSRRVLALAAARGWPVVAEPFGVGDRPGVLPHGPLALSIPGLLERAAPRRILLVGRITLSRATAALLRTPGVRVEAVTDRTRWADPGHVLHAVHPWSALEASLAADPPAAGLAAVSSAQLPAELCAGDDAVPPGPAADAPEGLPAVTTGPEAAPVVSPAGPVDATDAVPSEWRDADPDGPSADEEDCAWRRTWQRAGAELHRRVETWLAQEWPDDATAAPTGPALAHALLAALPDDATLFLGSSNSARDVEAARGPRGPFVAGSRGLAGIDGCVSTAAGIALGRPDTPTYALVGDLTFLHDTNGLLIGPGEPAPDLTIVVADDRGGGIFSTLEYGDPTRRAADPAGYERVFATPTQVDLAALCAAHGVDYARVESAAALAAAVARRPRGLGVVHVPIRRDAHRDAYAALRELAAGTSPAADRAAGAP